MASPMIKVYIGIYTAHVDTSPKISLPDSCQKWMIIEHIGRIWGAYWSYDIDDSIAHMDI